MEKVVLIMFLKELLFRNFSVKLVSLALAIILWSFVVGQEKAEVSLSVPVAIVNIPEHLVIANDFPANVNVRVFGPKMMLARLAASVPSKVIDLKTAGEGVTRVEITADDFEMPGGVSITRIQPSEIDIVLEHLVTKTIPVKVNIDGRVNSDYKIDSINIVPPSIEISGPESVVKHIDELYTRPLHVENRSATFTKEIKVELPYESIRSAATEQVKVTVNILPAIGMKRFKGVKLTVVPENRDVSIRPGAINITVTGKKPVLHNMTPEDIKAVIDISGLAPGSHRIKPEIVLSNDMKVIQTAPDTITVRIKKTKKNRDNKAGNTSSSKTSG